MFQGALAQKEAPGVRHIAPDWKGSAARVRSTLDVWDIAAIVLALAGGATAVVCAQFVRRPPPPEGPGGVYGWWLAGQIAGTVIAAGLPALSALRAKVRQARAVQREIDVRTQAHIEMNEALDPIVRTLGSGEPGVDK